jgi:hypothetical protein
VVGDHQLVIVQVAFAYRKGKHACAVVRSGWLPCNPPATR